MATISNTQRKKRQREYIRAGIVPIETVLPLIKHPDIKSVVLLGRKVNVTSLRLQTFAKSCTCSDCGLEATHFAVENNSNWHLNLWADRGPDKKEMLFTHDHTLARGLGGADDESNVTTMCAKCNHEKSVGEYAAFCKLKGLPPPGTKTSVKKTDDSGNPIRMAAPGERIVKKSGRPFKCEESEVTVESICTSLMDPKRRLAYVVVEDQTIVSAHGCRVVLK